MSRGGNMVLRQVEKPLLLQFAHLLSAKVPGVESRVVLKLLAIPSREKPQARRENLRRAFFWGERVAFGRGVVQPFHKGGWVGVPFCTIEGGGGGTAPQIGPTLPDFQIVTAFLPWTREIGDFVSADVRFREDAVCRLPELEKLLVGKGRRVLGKARALFESQGVAGNVARGQFQRTMKVFLPLGERLPWNVEYQIQIQRAVVGNDWKLFREGAATSDAFAQVVVEGLNADGDAVDSAIQPGVQEFWRKGIGICLATPLAVGSEREMVTNGVNEFLPFCSGEQGWRASSNEDGTKRNALRSILRELLSQVGKIALALVRRGTRQGIEGAVGAFPMAEWYMDVKRGEHALTHFPEKQEIEERSDGNEAV